MFDTGALIAIEADKASIVDFIESAMRFRPSTIVTLDVSNMKTLLENAGAAIAVDRKPTKKTDVVILSVNGL